MKADHAARHRLRPAAVRVLPPGLPRLPPRLAPRLAARLFALLLAAAALAPAAAQTPPSREAESRNRLPRVEVDVPPGELTVGDRVTLQVVVTTLEAAEPEKVTPRFPAWGETWGEAEVVEVGEVAAGLPGGLEGSHGTTSWHQPVTVAVFRPGTVSLPPREIVVPGEGSLGERLATPRDLALEIASVLPTPAEGEAASAAGAGGAGSADGSPPIPEPQPEKPLVELPLGAAFWWTAGLLLLALAALAALLLRRRRGEAAGGARPDLPPAEELRRALATARTAPRPELGLAGVSLALRRYLGRRLAFPAAEGTTTEVRRQLTARRLPGGVAARCGELLAACDLVKFARRPATRSDVERWADAAGEVAERIEEHLRAREEEAAAAAAAAERATTASGAAGKPAKKGGRGRREAA